MYRVFKGRGAKRSRDTEEIALDEIAILSGT
jgi:hypothetical protein